MPRPVKPRSTQDYKLASSLRALRQHCVKCASCREASKSGDTRGICSVGIRLVLEVLKSDQDLWSIKQSAYIRQDGAVYACPDIKLHGQSAMITAAPLIVTDYVERLF